MNKTFRFTGFPALQHVARKKEVLGRWLVQHGFSHVPKASAMERPARADLGNVVAPLDRANFTGLVRSCIEANFCK